MVPLPGQEALWSALGRFRHRHSGVEATLTHQFISQKLFLTCREAWSRSTTEKAPEGCGSSQYSTPVSSVPKDSCDPLCPKGSCDPLYPKDSWTICWWRVLRWTDAGSSNLVFHGMLPDPLVLTSVSYWEEHAERESCPWVTVVRLPLRPET